jgi:hypothetical protein
MNLGGVAIVGARHVVRAVDASTGGFVNRHANDLRRSPVLITKYGLVQNARNARAKRQA